MRPELRKNKEIEHVGEPKFAGRALGVPRTRIERLASEQTGVTPDTALRLGKFFNTTPEFWMTLQASDDLKVHAASLEADLAAIRQYEAA